MKRKIVRVHRPERDRAMFAVLRAIRGKSNAEAAAGSGISPQTIRLWRLTVEAGGTRFPQFYSLNQVAKAHGLEFKLVERNDDARPSSHASNGYEARA